MRSIIAKIFGKSPFAPLLKHFEKVSDTIDHLPLLFKAIQQKDTLAIEKESKIISKLEHEADLSKNDIRNHFSSDLFIPIDKAALFDILAMQDAFADIAENIAVIATLKPIEDYEKISVDFEPFCIKTVKTFDLVSQVMHEFEGLLESSFGGIEAQKVKKIISKLAQEEHNIDLLQFQLIKKLYKISDQINYASFNHWQSLIREIGEFSNLAEKFGNRIRMILELK